MNTFEVLNHLHEIAVNLPGAALKRAHAGAQLGLRVSIDPEQKSYFTDVVGLFASELERRKLDPLTEAQAGEAFTIVEPDNRTDLAKQVWPSTNTKILTLTSEEVSWLRDILRLDVERYACAHSIFNKLR